MRRGSFRPLSIPLASTEELSYSLVVAVCPPPHRLLLPMYIYFKARGDQVRHVAMSSSLEIMRNFRGMLGQPHPMTQVVLAKTLITSLFGQNEKDSIGKRA